MTTHTFMRFRSSRSVWGVSVFATGSNIDTYVLRNVPTGEWKMDGIMDVDIRSGPKILMAGLAQSHSHVEWYASQGSSTNEIGANQE